ncbi:MAG: hypothetical protein C0501_30325 [Isosphaera sp.]|nr:hypothetical protein [Isosphaera sp.]
MADDEVTARLVVEVKERVRREVGASPAPPARTSDAAAGRAATLRCAVDLAGHAADLGGCRPAAAGRGGLAGRVSGLVGKVILKAIWFVAGRQSAFNRLTVAALTEGERLRADLEARVAALEAAARDARGRTAA